MPSESTEAKARRDIARIINKELPTLEIDPDELFIWEIFKVGFNVGVRESKKYTNEAVDSLILEMGD